jgi:outer membrane receptor for ferrienterochelin and colicin
VTPGYAQDTSPRCAAPAASAGDLFSIDLESLMDMKIVTASKFEENVGDAPGIVSMISRDDLRRFGGMTLREVLDRVPGLSFATSMFTDRSILTARGNQTKNNSSHVLFLIDGRPTREIQEGGIVTDLVESFPLSVIERIEVVKGPGSVLYGSNAFSSVVNLITIKPDRAGMNVAAVRSVDFFTGTPSAIPATVQGHGPGAFVKASYGGLSATGLFTGYETSAMPLP